jgi:hypothetical protein
VFMMVRPDEAVWRERTRPDGGRTTDLRYFGKLSGRDTRCEAFLVHVEDRVVRSHFHPIDQFQILLGAPGSRYQRQELPALTLHYADAYATYGPMSGGYPPLRFFTLRAEASAFTAYMPEERDKLAWRGRRHRQVGFDRLSDDDFPATGISRVDQIWDPDDDGLEALAIVAGPSTEITLPATHCTSGQFIMTSEGSVYHGGRECGPESLAWQDAGEPAVQLVTGNLGCRLFVARYPEPSTSARHRRAWV